MNVPGEVADVARVRPQFRFRQLGLAGHDVVEVLLHLAGQGVLAVALDSHHADDPRGAGQNQGQHGDRQDHRLHLFSYRPSLCVHLSHSFTFNLMTPFIPNSSFLIFRSRHGACSLRPDVDDVDIERRPGAPDA